MEASKERNFFDSLEDVLFVTWANPLVEREKLPFIYLISIKAYFGEFFKLFLREHQSGALDFPQALEILFFHIFLHNWCMDVIVELFGKLFELKILSASPAEWFEGLLRGPGVFEETQRLFFDLEFFGQVFFDDVVEILVFVEVEVGDPLDGQTVVQLSDLQSEVLLGETRSLGRLRGPWSRALETGLVLEDARR